MTCDKNLLSDYIEKPGPHVTFGCNSKGYTRGYGNIKVGKTTISNVSYVEGLSHNLFSVSQFCTNANQIVINANNCLVQNKEADEILLTGK